MVLFTFTPQSNPMNNNTSRPPEHDSSEDPSKPTLEILVEEHFEYVYRYAFRFARNESEAEDLCQETFLAAVQGIKRFEGKSSPRTWLIGILRFKISDRLRKKGRDVLGETANFDEQVMPNLFDNDEHWTVEAGPLLWGDSPEDALTRKQFQKTLESCLSKLPQGTREIFLLREVEGLERDEICERTSLSSSNVGVILHRARLALQRCLQLNWYMSNTEKCRGGSL